MLSMMMGVVRVGDGTKPFILPIFDVPDKNAARTKTRGISRRIDGFDSIPNAAIVMVAVWSLFVFLLR